MKVRCLLLLTALLASCGDRIAEPSASEPVVSGPRLDQVIPAKVEPVEEQTPPEPIDWDGVRPVTFADLSLVGSDVNGLIDLIFSADPSSATFEFPESVEDLAGETISMVGYMIALDFEEDRVTHFMLVRDLAACCFGGIPRPDEWVDVQVSAPCKYWVYRPVRVTGKLSVGLDKQEDGLVASVFQIKSGVAKLEH
ncbi:MAG: DUF3299 domain-containing protein [Planctomycetota bacterium]|nr:DUF3299 domain-containing protein [Planctomycetota bacterium]